MDKETMEILNKIVDYITKDSKEKKVITQPKPSIEIIKPKKVRKKRYFNKNSRWTSYEDNVLLQLYKAGKTSGKIAKEIGRTRSGVYNRLNKLTK